MDGGFVRKGNAADILLEKSSRSFVLSFEIYSTAKSHFVRNDETTWNNEKLVALLSSKLTNIYDVLRADNFEQFFTRFVFSVIFKCLVFNWINITWIFICIYSYKCEWNIYTSEYKYFHVRKRIKYV